MVSCIDYYQVCSLIRETRSDRIKVKTKMNSLLFAHQIKANRVVISKGNNAASCNYLQQKHIHCFSVITKHLEPSVIFHVANTLTPTKQDIIITSNNLS